MRASYLQYGIMDGENHCGGNDPLHSGRLQIYSSHFWPIHIYAAQQPIIKSYILHPPETLVLSINWFTPTGSRHRHPLAHP